jgi:FkbM family methyltransferase
MSLSTTATAPRRFSDLLTAASRVRYILWRLVGWPAAVVVRLRDGLRLTMRRFPRTTDYGVAYEIFYHRVYAHPWLPAKAATIVDLGGNVGYSMLWWSRQYPDARIVVYEPMPEQAGLIATHVRLNGLESRVTIHAAAVGVRSGDAILVPSGARSVLRTAGDGIRVPVVDLLDELAGVPIDVLKIDIEGSEHPLLADDRFATLRVGVLVMEWHNTAAVPQARLACKALLEAAGYEVQDGADAHDGAGVFWARRAAAIASPGLR